MRAFGLLISFALVVCVAPACGAQDSAPGFRSLNGNWNLVFRSGSGEARSYKTIFRVDGDRIYGSLDFSLLCRRADGSPIGYDFQRHVQGEIGEDGNLAVTNVDPHYPSAGTVFIRGLVPGPNPDDWSGSFSVPVFEVDNGTQCPAFSSDFTATRFRAPTGVYSGVLKVQGTRETVWVTLEMGPGVLAISKGAPSLLDRSIRVEGKLTVSPSSNFDGGTFAGSPPQGGENQLGPESFSMIFQNDPAVTLFVTGLFDPVHEHRINVWLTRYIKGVAGWLAAGELTLE